MITETLNKQVLSYIINDVETTLHRLSVDAHFSIEKRENYRGEFYEVLVSNSFQTTPMLFKEIHVEGRINIGDKVGDPDKKLVVVVALEYRYKLFDGGGNGHTLGRVIFEVDKNFKGEKPCKFMSMVVYKVKSLEI